MATGRFQCSQALMKYSLRFELQILHGFEINPLQGAVKVFNPFFHLTDFVINGIQ